jgi:hypothetical protein
MNGQPLNFDARIVKARKQHQCWACDRAIAEGEVHIAYPGKNSEGKFMTTRLCVECSYLLTQKTGANAHNIRQGEFSEMLLPNCLRKKRTEFRKDPKAAITAAGLTEVKPPAPPRPVQQIIVKACEFNRRIFHMPEGRYKVEQFPKGQQLTVKAGVKGKSRAVTIKGAWSTSGKPFGCKERQVAILVA